MSIAMVSRGGGERNAPQVWQGVKSRTAVRSSYWPVPGYRSGAIPLGARIGKKRVPPNWLPNRGNSRERPEDYSGRTNPSSRALATASLRPDAPSLP